MKLRAHAAVIAWLLVTSTARADDAPRAALAERLFRDGRALLAEGKVREACESFGESKKLDPTPGTLLNLARCLEDLGRTASAWATYRELETRAGRVGQDARARFAREKVAELEPRLATLEIRVAPEHRIEGMTVECDGTLLGSAALSTRVPVDPARHVVVVRAPGHQAWNVSVDVAPSLTSVVEVPALVPDPTRSEPATTSARTSPGPVRPIGIGLAIIGGAATVTGLILGGAAKITNDHARRDGCTAGGCTADGLARIHHADDLATASTVVTIGGLSLAAVGVALWLLAPTRTVGPSQAMIGPGTRLFAGTF